MPLFKLDFLSLNKLNYKLHTHLHAYTLEAACVAVKQAQPWDPSGVCQGSLQRLALLWRWWMICQDNVPLMPSSSLPRRGEQPLLGERGAARGYLSMCPIWCVGVCVVGWMDARAAEVVLFYQSVVRHEWDGRGITRVSGFGLEHEWNVREHKVKHSDLCTTSRGTPYFNGVNPWSVSDSNLRPSSLAFSSHSHLWKHSREISWSCYLDTACYWTFLVSFSK